MNEEDDCAGVYVWVFLIDGKFVPYYVGKAANVIWRLTDHISALLGGNYTIYDKRNLVNYLTIKAKYNPLDYKTKISFIKERNIKYKEHVDFRSNRQKLVIKYFGIDKLKNQRGGEPINAIDVGNLPVILKESVQ